MKKITPLLFICLFVIVFSSRAQTNTDDLTGAQILRTARAIYDQGRLHELPVMLEAVLKKNRNKLTESERVEALQILVLSYIYLEEPKKADEKMIELLKADHFFELKESDPIEFQNLYKKFRTKPIFSIGAKVGVNFNQINVQKNHYIWGASQGKGTYTSNLGVQFGLLFEKELTDKFVLNPEVFYSTTSFTYSNSNISSVDSSEVGTKDNSTFNISQTRLHLNVLAQYKIGKSKFSPYIAIGPSIGYLMNSSFGGELTVESQITIPTLKTNENYKTMSYGVIAAAGIKYKVGGFYLTADVRYHYGLGNLVKKDNRYTQTELNEKLHNYGYVDNDFSLSQSMFNIGLIIPYFNPKKLIK